MKITVPAQCHVCGEPLTIERVGCDSCGCAVDGKFGMPRLARLAPEEQKFIEMFVTLSGNLKNLAAALGISYPTVRNRLDNVIAALEKLEKEDRSGKEQLIDSVERGEIPASLAVKIMEES